MKIVAIALIILGSLGLIWGGIQYTYKDKVVDLGPVEITHDKTKTIPIPPIAGAICLAAGVVILLSDKRGASRI